MFNILLLLVFIRSNCKAEEDVSPAPRIVFQAPKIPNDAIVALYFDSSADINKFILSNATKEGVESNIAKYDGKWAIEVPTSSAILNDYALILLSKAKHHALAFDFKKDFQFSAKEFVLQYEVNFRDGISCGGGYVKLLSASPDLNLNQFNDKTPYTIMFGPDKCGLDNKVHFIFRHKNPISKATEEKHAKQSSHPLDKYFTDKKTHLYTLVIRSDNSFEIFLDQNIINSGSLLKDMTPPVNPPTEIDDPNEKKPADWDDRPNIPDSKATKPDDWDEEAEEMIIDEAAVMPDGWLLNEPTLIPDPNAERPEDWDEDTDGEWEPAKIENPVCASAPGCGEWNKPLIKNPKYKGKWVKPMIPNPDYKGEWKAKKIPNPHFFEDNEPYKMMPIRALGLELWTLSDQIEFDNFYVGTSKKGADDFAAETWVIKHTAEVALDQSSKSVVDGVRDMVSEKPWIVALIILVVAVPIVLLIIFCCRSTPETEDTKKTDRPVPDDENVKKDVHVSADEEDEEEVEIEDVDIAGKSDLEKEDGSDEVEHETDNKPMTKLRQRKE